MKFQIAQKLVQTDWYIVEAESPEQALEIYIDTMGEISSIGSTAGWTYDENQEIAIAPIKEESSK